MVLGRVEHWLQTLPVEAKQDAFDGLTEIATLLVRKKIQFLLGAGMSKASGLKLAEDLSKVMVSKLTGGDGNPPFSAVVTELSKQFPLEAIAEGYSDRFDSARLNELVRLEYGKIDKAPQIHAGHAALEYFASQNLLDRIYTTNFDLVTESAFGDRAEPVDDHNADLVRNFIDESRFPVIHLHGHVKGQRCLIKERDVFDLDTPLQRLVSADMVSHWFVWVGYRLADPDLRWLYLSMKALLDTKELTKRPFVIHPLTLKADERAAEWRFIKEIWDARHVRFVPGKAEEVLPALRERVRRLKVDDDIRRFVARKADPDESAETEAIWAKARDLSRTTGFGDEVDAVEAILAEQESK